MRKQISIVMAVLMAAFGVTACGSSSGSGSTSAAAAVSSAAQVPVETSAKTETEKAEKAKADWPKGTVELVVPYNAGGDTDLYCRAIADAMSKKTGATFVVSNITGASAMNAAVDVLEGPADGSKFLFGHNTYLSYTANGTAAVDVVTELKPAGTIVADNSLVLLATKATGFKTIQDVVDAGNAGQEVRLTCGVGSFPYYCVMKVLNESGAKVRRVETGSLVGEHIVGCMSGQAEMTLGQYVAVKEYVESGDFNVIGVVADELPKGMEKFQTFKAQGVNVVEPKYYCFWASPNMDDSIIQAFTETLEEIQNDEGLKEVLENYNAEAHYMNPQEMQAMEEQVVSEMTEFFKNNQ